MIHANPLPNVAELNQQASQMRDTQQWPEAISLFRQGVKRYPQNLRFAVGLTMTLADAGKIDAGREQAAQLVNQWPSEPDAYIAAAYVEFRAQRPYAALALTDRAYTLKPKQAYIQREYIFALQRAGLPFQALTLAEQHPDLLTPQHLRTLVGDTLAERTRLSTLPARPDTNRYVIADRVLHDYTKTIKKWTQQPGTEQDIARLRIDRLSALHARQYNAEVVKEYEALIHDGTTVPNYALSVVASSYLTLRQPETAADLYWQLLKTPDGAWRNDRRVNDEIGLYYALLESGRYEQALSLITQADNRQPIWLRLKGQPERLPNPQKLSTALTRTMAYYALDNLEQAQVELDDMVAKAPNNTSLRSARATVYRARGRPRAAELDLQLAQTMTPRALDVEMGQAYTAMQLHEWQQAHSLINDLRTRFAQEPGVQALERDWLIHQRPEIRVEAYRGLASDNPAVGNRDWGFDTSIYTSPLAYNWRAFAGTGQATASFDDENIDYRWQRAGLQWRSRNIDVEAEVSSNRFGYGAKPGLQLQANIDLNDSVSLGLSGAWKSRETPLRALKDNISSNSAGISLAWSPGEKTAWTTGLNFSRYTDGNRRFLGLISGQQRLLTRPTYQLNATLELSFQHNTAENTNYFNPRSDLTVVPGLVLNQTLHRRYDTHWQHFVRVGAGSYTQKGYGTGALFSLGYGQRISLNKVFDAGVSVTAASRPYDGAREKELRIQLDLNYRF